MSLDTVFTIGVYGSTENEFFDKLVFNKIDLFIDIRRRRAVRGSKYAFVNSKRLQKRLKELLIPYLHILELAPTAKIREIQKEVDKRNSVLKSTRSELSNEFILEYKREILDKYNIANIIEDKSVKNILLFCVEKEAVACHRSLVAAKINQDFNIQIKNL